MFPFPVFCPVCSPLVLACYISLSVLPLRLGPLSLCLLPVVLVVGIFRLFPSGFLSVVIMGSEILVSMVCLFVFYELICFYRLLLCSLFRLPRFEVYFCMRFQMFLCFFSRNRYGKLLLTSSFSFLGASITNWS